MQTFAPLEDLTGQGECPSAEDLAAYIDGVLPKDEASRVTEHLASCEECYEVYAGTVRFKLDTEPVPKGEVIFFPTERWKPAVVWTSIAAVLVVGVGLGGYRHLLATPPALTDVTAPKGDLWLGPTSRGIGNKPVDVPIDDLSFRMGVQLVNLQVSLEAGDGETATDVNARILQTLEDHPFPGGLDESYKEKITFAINDGKPPGSLIGEASQLATESREIFDSLSLDLGQWVEAGRLAAIAREPGFFERQDSRAFLRRVLWREKVRLGETRLDPETRGHLQEISRILGDGDLQGQDYQALRSQLEKILNAKYPE